MRTRRQFGELHLDMLQNFSIYSYLYSFFTMLQWQQLHKRSYLKRMLNDTEQSGEGLRINLNETLICWNMRYVYLLLYKR